VHNPWRKKTIGMAAVAVVIIAIVVFVAAIAGGFLEIPGPGGGLGTRGRTGRVATNGPRSIHRPGCRRGT